MDVLLDLCFEALSKTNLANINVASVCCNALCMHNLSLRIAKQDH